MAKKTWKQYLVEDAARLGLKVAEWSPGDGVTRYRFHSDPNGDYFNDSGIYTALGKREAVTFLAGYNHGRGSK